MRSTGEQTPGERHYSLWRCGDCHITGAGRWTWPCEAWRKLYLTWGDLCAKGPSWSHCHWNWRINSCSKSAGPWTVGLVHCLLVVLDFLFFSSDIMFATFRPNYRVASDEAFPSLPMVLIGTKILRHAIFWVQGHIHLLQAKSSPYCSSDKTRNKHDFMCESPEILCKLLIAPKSLCLGTLVKGGASWELAFSVNLRPMYYFALLLNWKIRWRFTRKYSRKSLWSLLRPQVAVDRKSQARGKLWLIGFVFSKRVIWHRKPWPQEKWSLWSPAVS